MRLVAVRRGRRRLILAGTLLLPAAVWASETAQPLQVETAPAQPLPPPPPSAAPMPAHSVPPAPAVPPAPTSQPSIIPDLVYKGVVGKALDAVPMDAENRASLQRGNAVISGTLAGRALGMALMGSVNPVFGIVGLAWGVYSAYNIKPEDAAGGRNANGIAALPAAPRVIYEFPQAVSLTRLAHMSVSETCD